jgi:hypothetical protein
MEKLKKEMEDREYRYVKLYQNVATRMGLNKKTRQ